MLLKLFKAASDAGPLFFSLEISKGTVFNLWVQYSEIFQHHQCEC